MIIVAALGVIVFGRSTIARAVSQLRGRKTVEQRLAEYGAVVDARTVAPIASAEVSIEGGGSAPSALQVESAAMTGPERQKVNRQQNLFAQTGK